MNNGTFYTIGASGESGCVRETARSFSNYNEWVFIEADGNYEQELQFLNSQLGVKYGFLELLNFLLPFRLTNGGMFCSELTAKAKGISDYWDVSPGDFAQQLIGSFNGKILTRDEVARAFVL